MPTTLTEVVFGWVMLAWFWNKSCVANRAGTLFGPWWNDCGSSVVSEFPISGAAFMVDWLPDSLQKIVLTASDGQA